jgi:hypothetical protein
MNDQVPMMTRHLVVMIVLLCGCSSTDTTAPSMPPAQQPATQPSTSPPAATPTVNAGSDQTVKLGDIVHLSGSSTTTDEHPSYLWSFASVPQGSAVTLSDPTSLTPTFMPDVVGLYILTLILNSGASDQVTIDVQANLITLHFLSGAGTTLQITGTFTYEASQGPTATNVKSLMPNVLYRLSSWEITVQTTGALADVLPSTIYSSTQPGNSSEFCSGVCQLSTRQRLQLIFANASPFALTLLFESLDPTPFINPPTTLAEWGAFVQGTYRVPQSVPVVFFDTGTLTQEN